jgi:hypothetical protein
MDVGVSMAEFRAAYEEHLPMMTADELVQWTQTGVALATATQAAEAYSAALANIDSLLASLDPNAAAAGTWEAALAGINAQFDDAMAKLTALGATTEQLAQAEKDRAAAIAKAQNAAVQNYASLVQQLQQGYDDLAQPPSDFQKALRSISTALAQTIDQLNAAAKAAGLQAAREEDLALAHKYAALQASVAAHQLELDSRDLVSQLYGVSGDDLAKQAQAVGSGMQSVADGIGSIQSAVDKFRNAMLIDSSLSPLNTQKQYDEAIKQLRATGDESIARTALELARKLDASGDAYTQKFNLITSLVRSSADAAGGGYSGSAASAASSQSQLTELQRSQLAQQLAQNVADFAGFSGTDFADIAKSWGFSLDDLAKDLGLQGASIEDYLQSLEASNYSIDDLDSMIGAQVDRLIDAINDNLIFASIADLVTGQLDAISGKPGARVVDGPVLDGPTFAPPALPDFAPVAQKLDEADATQKQQLAESEKQTDLQKGIGSAIASTGTDTVAAIETLSEQMAAVERAVRALADAQERNRSTRTSPQVAWT